MVKTPSIICKINKTYVQYIEKYEEEGKDVFNNRTR